MRRRKREWNELADEMKEEKKGKRYLWRTFWMDKNERKKRKMQV